MLILSNARVVLADRYLTVGAVAVDGDRIVDVVDGRVGAVPASATVLELEGATIAPGFVDGHIHGVSGHDVLDDADAIGRIARILPRFGVTAFSPTSVACTPHRLGTFLEAVRQWRQPSDGARVLPAHLESNFVNPAFGGAQPAACLRCPSEVTRLTAERRPAEREPAPSRRDSIEAFGADDIIDVIERAEADVGVVTLAPELEGALPLIRWFTDRGVRVSIGHTGATFDQAVAGIEAGATRGTHVFNRMPPMHHRAPGAAGALLDSDRVTVELIGDGCHVHPVLMRTVIARKGVSRTMAVTDATAVAGLPMGSQGRLAGRTITAGADVARLEDDTIAGSLVTMDAVFRFLIDTVGLSIVEASTLCATTPAREHGLRDHGAVGVGLVADLVVLDRSLRVTHTLVGGRIVFAGTATEPGPSTLAEERT